METLKFKYTSDGVSSFDITYEKDDGQMDRQSLFFMGLYIEMLFLKMKSIGQNIGDTDIDEMIRDLMNRKDSE